MPSFPSTRWSLIQAGGNSPAVQREAWELLVRNYQPAILGYFRRSALSRDAEDLAQEFLLRSMRDGWWGRADPDNGSFRVFLLMLLKRFVTHERKAGHRRFEVEGGDLHALEQEEAWKSPERQFDLAFAACLAQEAVAELRVQFESENRVEMFEQLLPFIADPPEHGDLARTGSKLGIHPNTLAVQLKRLRFRFQKQVKAKLASLCVDAQHAASDTEALRQALSTEGAS